MLGSPGDLLGYLLSRPDDWKVLLTDICKRVDPGCDGSICGFFRELRDAGYVRFMRPHGNHGRTRGGTYILTSSGKSQRHHIR